MLFIAIRYIFSNAGDDIQTEKENAQQEETEHREEEDGFDNGGDEENGND